MNEKMKPVIDLLQEMLDEIYVHGRIENFAKKYNCSVYLDSYPATGSYRVVSLYGSVICVKFTDTIDDPQYTNGITVPHDYTAMHAGPKYIRYTEEHIFENMDIPNDLFALNTILDNEAIQDLYVLGNLINHEKYFGISLFRNTIKCCMRILKL